MSVANRVTKFLNRNEAHSSNIEDKCLKILSLCKSQPSEQALCVHTPILKLGLLHKNLYLTNNVLTVYAKCRGPETARQLFDEMPHRDIVSWTGLVSAYTRNDEHDKALEIFDSMVVCGESPNEFTFSSVLRSCSSLGEFDVGTRVHALVVKLGLKSNTFLLSALIDFYSKSGFIEEALQIFEEMEGGDDTVTWTAMLSSLVKARRFRSALRLYFEMLRARVLPNEFTFQKLLEASGSDPSHGKLLHAHLTVLGVRLSPGLKTGLVEMYSGFQRTDLAVKVTHWSTEHDVVLWTSLISGFTDNLRVKEALSSLTEMKSFGVSPNNFTFSNLLKACWTISSLELGRQIHSRVIKTGLESDVCVGNSLVEMYLTCSNSVNDGLRAFDEIDSPNVVTWTSLISGYSNHGFEGHSFESFYHMRAQGVKPNSFTISVILSICSVVKSHTQTTKLHGYVIKAREDFDIVVGNALVDSYASMGEFDESRRVLRAMSQRDAITYTCLATRMNDSGRPEATLGLVKTMSEDGVEMDGFSLAGFLSASAELAALETGKQLHCRAVKSGLGSFRSVSNALVDFYWKCGVGDRSNDGQRAFDEISKPDIVSWNGLISGLASNGLISKALSVFDDMRLNGFEPDSITFLSLLFACSRGGLVDLGVDYFNSMRTEHFIAPKLDHYVCLVDLLGRSGQLENAMDVIDSMPFDPNPLIYKTLLSSCRLHKNIPLGEDLARRGIKLDPYDSIFYSLLANLYEDSGRADLAKKTRQLMRDKGLRRNIGQSWMEIRDKVHVFESGDVSHPRINEICDKIESIVTELKRRGYDFLVTDGSGYHSEKLAVGFGLLVGPSNAVIRIKKNMRICGDCHEFIILVTRLVDREIIVRDGNRIHNFKRGKCSCQGC